MPGTLDERLASTDPGIYRAAVAEALSGPDGTQHRSDRRAAHEQAQATSEPGVKKTARKK